MRKWTRYAKFIDAQTVEFAPEIKDNIVGYCNNVEMMTEDGYKQLMVEPKTSDKPYYEVQGDFIMQKWKKENKLRIINANSYLSAYSDSELMNTDIDLLQGLIKQRQHARGYLIRKKYSLASDTSKLAILREYSLVWDNEVLKGERSIIRWYREDGTVGLVKEDIVNYTAKDAASVLREIRQTRIDYLQYPEPQFVNATTQGYITSLFARYKTQVNEYILSGNKAFEDAINAESNTTYLAILNAKLADGKTVRESILYQISGGY